MPSSSASSDSRKKARADGQIKAKSVTTSMARMKLTDEKTPKRASPTSTTPSISRVPSQQSNSGAPTSDTLESNDMQLLESLLGKARQNIETSDPQERDQQTCWSSLERCLTISGVLVMHDNNSSCGSMKLDPNRNPNFRVLRCVSSAYYNAAAVLYNSMLSQLSRRFFERSVSLCELLLEAFSVGNTNKDFLVTDEQLGLIKRQLRDRRDLLASVYYTLQNYRMAYDIYLKGIIDLSASELEENRQFLRRWVAKCTKIGVHDLLLNNSETYIIPHLRPGTPMSAKGMILDAQIDAVSRNSDKDVSVRHLGKLTRAAVMLWSAEMWPMKRATALCRLLQHIVSVENIIDFESSDDPDVIFEEILHLTPQEVERPPEKSKRSIPSTSASTRAMAHLWMCLRTTRSRDSDSVIKIVEHARKVIDFLTPEFHSNALDVRNNQKGGVRSQKIKTPVNAKVQSKADPSRSPKPFGGNTSSKKGSVNLPLGMIDHLSLLANVLGGLGFLELQIELLRLLCSINASRGSDDLMLSTLDLSNEYLQLGLVRQAWKTLSKAKLFIDEGHFEEKNDIGIAIVYHLRQAECLSMHGDSAKSAASYATAASLHKDYDPATAASGSSFIQRVVQKCRQILLAYFAVSTFSVLQECRGDLHGALKASLHAARLLHRGLGNLSRLSLNPVNVDMVPGESIFSSETTQSSSSAATTSRRRKGQLAGALTDSLTWKFVHHLNYTNLRLTQLYSVRGSLKPAVYFSQQAVELAEDLDSSHALARPLLARAELSTSQNEFHSATEDLNHVNEIITSYTDFINLRLYQVWAQMCFRDGESALAQKYVIQAQKHLDSLHKRVIADPKLPEKVPIESDRAVFDDISAHLLRIQVCVKDLNGRNSQYSGDLKQLQSDRLSELTKIRGMSLSVHLNLQSIDRQFARDPVLGLLHDSSLSIPSGVSLQSTPKPKKDSGNPVGRIDQMLQNLQHVFVQGCSRLMPWEVREVGMSYARYRLYEATAGQIKSANISSDIAHKLESTSCLAARRELIETVEKKLEETPNPRPDDLNWPQLATPNSNSQHDPAANTPIAQYWGDVLQRHRHAELDADITPSVKLELPESWTALSLHVSKDRNSIFAVRYEGNRQPDIFRLSPDRLDKREGEDEPFNVDAALTMLGEIISTNNETTKRAKNVNERQERKDWWEERYRLNSLMGELISNINHRWVGGFKALFAPPKKCSPGKFKTFKNRLENKILTAFLTSKERKNCHVRLDAIVFDCFWALGADCSDEDIEDLAHYAIEACQLKGVSVQCDEVDMTQLACDIQDLLKEFHGGNDTVDDEAENDSHLFLILDDCLHGLPWEALPVLNGRSVSRMPSISFLQDKIRLGPVWTNNIPACASDKNEFAVGDGRKGFYVLNPEGDLQKTESEFKPWLEDMAKVGWTGSTRRKPTELEVEKGLKTNDVVLYFGHGGAEQYIRSQTIRNMPRCAATFLWGCSSGVLKENGQFEATGTPWHYMLAGCPSLVATLWDVTDRDIDRMSKATLENLGLLQSAGGDRENGRQTMTVPQAIAGARSKCLMKFLNGAAPVVYGVPVRFLCT